MANVYWFGGTGNWSDAANHWSNNSGNSPASLHGAAPGTDDNAIFDTLSNATAYTVTIDATATCLNFTVGAPLAGTVTLAGSSNLSVYGNFTLLSGMTNDYTGTITFRQASGTQLITTNAVGLKSSLIFNDADTTFRLVDDLTISTSKNMTLTAGTFDAATNSKTVSLTSTAHTIIGAFTFYKLTRTGTASVFNTFTFANSQTVTVTNTLTINGNSATNRILVASNSSVGVQATINTTGGSVAVTNTDFVDIAVSGDAGDWDLSAIAGGSGNCGGNTGINFTAADEWYWYKNTGNFTSTTLWFTGSGGTGTRIDSDARNAKVILPQDTCYFDSSSFDAGSQTITQGMVRIGSVIWTGATNTPAFTTSTDCSVFGSITLIAGMTLTASAQAYTFEGRGSYTLDSGGLTWEKAIILNAPGGSGVLTLKSNLTLGATRTLTTTAGTLNCVDGANNWVISTGKFTMGASATHTLGSATHLITWAGAAGTVLTGAGTISANTSTIKFNGALTADITLANGTANYNGASFWNATTNAFALIVTGSGTGIGDFKIDAGREVNFTTGTNTTVATFTALGTGANHIVVHSTTATHATLTKSGGGVISGCDYIDIQEMTGSPTCTWAIGANSTDVGSTCTDIYLTGGGIYPCAAASSSPLCNLSLLGVG
jgi:hypothetical protein